MKVISWALLFSVVIFGCDSSAPPAGGPTTANGESADTPGVTDAGGNADSTTRNGESGTTSRKQLQNEGVTAEIASWEQTQQMIAEQTGKVVVLDVWSTYCEPCIKEFPGLVALQKKYPDQVVCLSLNLNYVGLPNTTPETDAEMVLGQLKDLNASAVRNIISSTADTEFYDAVGEYASIPAVGVYGPDGKLKKWFHNEDQEYGEEGFGYEQDIVPFVEELLSQ